MLYCFFHALGASGRAFQVVLVIKNPLARARDIRDPGLIPGSGRSPGGGCRHPLHFSAWRIPLTGAWQSRVYRVTELDTTDVT